MLSPAEQRIIAIQNEARALEEAGDLAAARERYVDELRRTIHADLSAELAALSAG